MSDEQLRISKQSYKLLPYTISLLWQETFTDFADFHTTAKILLLI